MRYDPKDMKKTKIVCTLGPATSSKDRIAKLIENGMNCARLNCSHGDHREKLEKIKTLRKISDKTAIMLDLKGPEIRTGVVQNEEGKGEIYLEDGDTIILTTDDVVGTKEKISVSYMNLPKEIKPQQKILLDDGLIELEVIEARVNDIECKILNGETLKSRKAVAVPGLQISLDFLTDEDQGNIDFAIEHNLDFIALSFVKSKDDILKVKKIIDEKGANIKIISKIEALEAVDNFDDILKMSDGIMVARGDLAVEISPEKVPIVQKEIIKECNIAAKPVIVATQMLESMIENPRPTRAEVNDVANAIMDGADALMLSAETAAGKYPIKVLKQMVKVATYTERNFEFDAKRILDAVVDDSIASFISKSVYGAKKSLNISAVITPTSSGFTPRLIARFNPQISILAITDSPDTLRQLALTWGVYATLGRFDVSERDIVLNSIKLALKQGLVEKDDTVAVTAGIPIAKPGTTNMIEIHKVESILRHHQ